MLNKITLSLVCALISSCVLSPYHTTGVAFVAIYNDTNETLSFQAGKDMKWGDISIVNADKNEFFYRYERESRMEIFPKEIGSFIFNFPDCLLTMNREHIDLFSQQPAGGRAGWDIHVSAELINKIGCVKCQQQ